MYKFKDILEKEGINVTIRRTLGKDIEAACGQLKGRYVKKEEGLRNGMRKSNRYWNGSQDQPRCSEI